MGKLPQIESVARALQRLVAYGARPHKAVTLAALRSLPQLDSNPPGEAIVDEIWAAAADLDGLYKFTWTGQQIPAQTVRKALWVLLHVDSWGRPGMREAPARRDEAKRMLGAAHISTFQWNRGGAEVAFLRILAQRLVERGVDKDTIAKHETAELTYHFSGTGGWTKVDVIRSLVPARPGTAIIREPYQECMDWRRLYFGLWNIKPLFGCAVQEPEFGEKVYGQDAVISAKLPGLAKGRPHFFGYSVSFGDFLLSPHSYQNPSRLPIIWFRPLHAFQETVVRLVFSEMWHPHAVYKFTELVDLADLEYWKTIDIGSDPDHPHTYSTRFSNPSLHLYHGLGWDFDDSTDNEISFWTRERGQRSRQKEP